ncbi:MFS transporter [Nocardioides sp. SLBN-35]|uniref:MFS transporter n=1 Tax=Nocardioides sp. SLBN-35 TaxID=2768445 RepID=UPI001167E8B5|nr:MFS transporter [Nocardioides sp. SLBN-35]TQK69138.1 MFS-type transporter involved in bile tolerance (Atg22 family) [Nocardioides sp. SLBN-35]
MPVQRLRPASVAALCVTELCALGALVVPLVVGLSLLVRELDSGLAPETRLSWVETTGALAGMTFNPVWGWLSDRRVRRGGDRTRWIVGGTVCGCAFAVTATFMPNLPLLVAVWACAQASYSATFAALYGTLSDVVPPADRTRVSGWFAAAATGAIALGGLIGYALLSGHFGAVLREPRASFVLLSIVAVPVAAVAAWHLRTLEPLPHEPAPVRRPADGPRGLVAVLAGAGAPYWWLWLQRLFAQAAYSCLTVYGVFFLIRRVGREPHDAASLVALVTAIGAATGMVMAIGGARALARRVGYRPVMAGGILLLLGANLVLTTATGTPAYVLALLCAGAGLGTYVALDLAVALAVLPHGANGRLLGYFNIARTLPQTVVPALGPAFLAIGSGDLVGVDPSRNYFAFFVFGSALAAVALVLLTRMTLPERDSMG